MEGCDEDTTGMQTQTSNGFLSPTVFQQHLQKIWILNDFDASKW